MLPNYADFQSYYSNNNNKNLYAEMLKQIDENAKTIQNLNEKTDL